MAKGKKFLNSAKTIVKGWFDWLWNNKFKALGVLFTWIAPIILILILGFETSDQPKTSVKIWALFVMIVLAFIYFIKLRKKLNEQKNTDLVKKGYVSFWVRFIDTIMLVMPFVVILLLVNELQNMLNEVYIFLACIIGTETLGGVFYMIESIQKWKETLPKEDVE